LTRVTSSDRLTLRTKDLNSYKLMTLPNIL
jgi:hypothetical protein